MFSLASWQYDILFNCILLSCETRLSMCSNPSSIANQDVYEKYEYICKWVNLVNKIIRTQARKVMLPFAARPTPSISFIF